MRKIIAMLAFALTMQALPALGAAKENEATIKALRGELAQVKTPADSVKILYDIFDLSSRRDYRDLGKEIYNTAGRAGDTASMLDIVRQVTAVLNDDKSYQDLEDLLKTLPESEAQKETMLFMQMKRVALKSRNMPEGERQQEIAELINELETNRRQDKFTRMLNLFKVVEYLRNDATGDMLKQYVDKMVDMIESNEFELYALGNLVYSEAANIYTTAEDHHKAIRADQKLIEVIEGLEKKYADMGRKYRDYDVSYYICYRRMLRNYEALAPGKAKAIYGKITELVKSNQDVANDFASNPYTHAYYHMAVGEYGNAIPYLKSLYQRDQAVSTRKQVLELLAKAAEMTGDDQTRIMALDEYKKIMEEYNSLNAAEKYKTLQIKYDIQALNERNAALELENREKEIKTARNIMIVVIAAFVLLVIALAVSLYNWSRYKKNIHKLTSLANHMTHERNRIRHRLFYEYDDAQKGLQTDNQQWKELLKKAKRSPLDTATFMVQLIINDLLHIAMLGKDSRDRHIGPTSVDTIMRRASTLAFERQKTARNISVTYPEDDFQIITDRNCLAFALGHLLHAAAANTREGEKVTMSYERRQEKLLFVFTVQNYFDISDENTVFDTMLSIDQMVQMKDSGMNVDRLIALLLASDIKYDRTYAEGTRFIFMTPEDLKSAMC